MFFLRSNSEFFQAPTIENISHSFASYRMHAMSHAEFRIIFCLAGSHNSPHGCLANIYKIYFQLAKMPLICEEIKKNINFFWKVKSTHHKHNCHSYKIDVHDHRFPCNTKFFILYCNNCYFYFKMNKIRKHNFFLSTVFK